MVNQTSEVISSGIKYLNTLFSGVFIKIIVAVVILLIGLIIGKIVGRLIHKVLHEIELNKIMEKARLKIALEEIISKIVMYLIYFTAILIALNQLGLTTAILNIVSAGIIALIILLVILALKDFVPNAFAGFFIYQKGYIKEGNTIKLGDLEGKIKKITLAETLIETKKKDIIYIPNSLLIKREVIIKRK